MLRSQSMKTLKSNRSEHSRSLNFSEPHLEFDDFIQQSVKQFGIPISVAVAKEYKRDQYTKGGKIKQETKFIRKSMIPLLQDLQSDEEVKPEKSTSETANDHTLLLMTHYDILNRLVEIHINKYQYQVIPRALIQLIAVIAPLNRQLTKFVIKRCRIDMYTIHELNKMLLITNITDVCLDQSPLPECNYDILLSDVSCLRYLSLARCKINDFVCGRIAARLHYLEPAENTLMVLNLSSNDITDEGVAFLGQALRTNRHLRYLNLADNHISDDGARHILLVLTEFPLTHDECTNKSKRYVAYLNKKRSLYINCLKHLTAKPGEDGSTRKLVKKGSALKKAIAKRDKLKQAKSDQDLSATAKIMVAELLGPLKDPFSSTTTKNGTHYCSGNLVLCYLNMAYNNLTYISIKKILDIISYQNQNNYKTDKLCGLMNVILEGNYVPANCSELLTINNELLKGVSHYYEKKNLAERRRKSTLTNVDKKLTPSGRQ